MDIQQRQNQIEESYKEGKLTEAERLRLLETLMWAGRNELKVALVELQQRSDKMGI